MEKMNFENINNEQINAMIPNQYKLNLIGDYIYIMQQDLSLISINKLSIEKIEQDEIVVQIYIPGALITLYKKHNCIDTLIFQQ